MTPRPSIRLEVFQRLLRQAHLSMAQLGRELPTPVTRYYVWRVAHGLDAVSATFERTVPVVIARHLDLDPGDVRSSLFTYDEKGVRHASR